MKITDLKTFVVGNPPPHFGGRYFVFLKLTTDGGVEGVGEVYGVPFHPDVVARMIEDVFERCVAGADPFKIERLWRIVYSSGYSQRPDLSVWPASSAGSRWPAGTSSARSWASRSTSSWAAGSTSACAPTPISIRRRAKGPRSTATPDLAAERAAAYVQKGFTAVKFDPVGPYSAFDPRQLSLEALEHTERFVRSLREAVGGKCDLLFGTHGQMTAAGAIRLARRLEPFDPLWFEEPTPPEMPEEMAKVARGDHDPDRDRRAARDQVRVRARARDRRGRDPADGARPGRRHPEAKKIAGMAEAHYAQIAPHLYCGPIEGAANIQLAACTPNFLILESIQTWGGFHAEILKAPIVWQDGYVIPAGRARPRRRAERGGRGAPSLHRQRAPPRDARPAGLSGGRGARCGSGSSDSAISARISPQACCARASSSTVHDLERERADRPDRRRRDLGRHRRSRSPSGPTA